MKFSVTLVVFFVALLNYSISVSQSIEFSKDFRLGSPNAEPGGKKDVVVLDKGEFVALSKVTGSAKKSVFVLVENFFFVLCSRRVT